MEIDRERRAGGQPKCRRGDWLGPLQDSVSEILEARRDQRGLIVALPDPSFDLRQSTIVAEAKDKLSKLARLLFTCPGAYRIEIDGAPCPAGADAGWLLCKDRTASVRNYLLQAGLPENQISVSQELNQVFGQKLGQKLGTPRPLATDNTLPGRGLGRIEILIIKNE